MSPAKNRPVDNTYCDAMNHKTHMGAKAEGEQRPTSSSHKEHIKTQSSSRQIVCGRVASNEYKEKGYKMLCTHVIHPNHMPGTCAQRIPLTRVVTLSECERSDITLNV